MPPASRLGLRSTAPAAVLSPATLAVSPAKLVAGFLQPRPASPLPWPSLEVPVPAPADPPRAW
eukprot:3890648-Rhodomonas_salina.2